MKFLYELDYEDKKETAAYEKLECAGGVDDVVAAICRSISLVYAKLLNYDLDYAETFRAAILVALLSPESPVFTVTPGDTVGNVVDITVAIPTPRKE